MILSVILFGCDNAKNEIYWSFNTDKAEETALEYMNEKYDKNFYIVSSEKNYDAGYIPTTIQEFWCDVWLLSGAPNGYRNRIGTVEVRLRQDPPVTADRVTDPKRSVL